MESWAALAEIHDSDRLFIFRNECTRTGTVVSGPVSAKSVIYQFPSHLNFSIFTSTIIIFSLVDFRLNGGKASCQESEM